MSTLIDLALKDADDNLSQTSSAQHQIKHYLDSTLRSLQAECVTLNNVIAMLDKDNEANALVKLNQAVEVNRTRYSETVKIADQLDTAISSLSRGRRWITAVSDEVKA